MAPVDNLVAMLGFDQYAAVLWDPPSETGVAVVEVLDISDVLALTNAVVGVAGIGGGQDVDEEATEEEVDGIEETRIKASTVISPETPNLGSRRFFIAIVCPVFERPALAKRVVSL